MDINKNPINCMLYDFWWFLHKRNQRVVATRFSSEEIKVLFALYAIGHELPEGFKPSTLIVHLADLHIITPALVREGKTGTTQYHKNGVPYCLIEAFPAF